MMIRKVKKIIVKLRMLYADIRGHHGKKWDYEPGEWYMGRHTKDKKKKKMKRYILKKIYHYSTYLTSWSWQKLYGKRTKRGEK
jgi:hypothetical protein